MTFNPVKNFPRLDIMDLFPHLSIPMKRIPFLLLIFSLLLMGCASVKTSDVAMVNLSDLQPLPTPVENEVRPLRVAIASVISPQGSVESYAPLLEYLSDKLDRPIERVQRRTYSEVNELIRNGEVDLAFVCTSAYLSGSREFGMQLLVVPQVNGETVYRAQLIVPQTSLAQTLEDLRGKIFAFTDPTSLTGRMYPTYLLQQAGETPQNFFARTFFTYSHDDAIYAVAEGLADGASVASVVLDFALKRDPSLLEKIRIIHTSDPFGMPPVVVGPQIRPQLLAELQTLLLEMVRDPAGLSVLQTLDYDQFVLTSPDNYLSARQIDEALLPLLDIEIP